MPQWLRLGGEKAFAAFASKPAGAVFTLVPLSREGLNAILSSNGATRSS
jgi:hypothetical protein